MDLVFELGDEDRVAYLLNLMHSFASSYVCLWAYSADHICLFSRDGYYNEATINLQASSSSGSNIARKLFDEYRQSIISLENNVSHVPGLAFRKQNPYMLVQELELQRLASQDSQRQFYQEARIKIAVFLGCKRGEIELGMTYIPQMNFEMKIQSLFPQDFSERQPSTAVMAEMIRPEEQNRPSPSSSFSLDSPEYNSLIYAIPTSSSWINEQTRETSLITNPQTTTTQSPVPTLPSLSELHRIAFPTQESTDDALMRAYLTVLSNPSSPTTSQPTSGQQGGGPPHEQQQRQRPTAFKRYGGESGPSAGPTRCNLRRQTLFKRVIGYFRGLNYKRMQEQQALQAGRPSSNQLHHMISERRRREKINESFQALRSLLPQGTKKDKATVLKTTKEYMSSLKCQLSELSKRNQLLEAQLVPLTSPMTKQVDVSATERLNVWVVPVSESTSSGHRMVDLQVKLIGENVATDLIIRVLEFLKQVRSEASLVSMEAQTRDQEIVGDDQHPAAWMTFRLRIEGTDWDESSFIEAVRRILANLAQ